MVGSDETVTDNILQQMNLLTSSIGELKGILTSLQSRQNHSDEQRLQLAGNVTSIAVSVGALAQIPTRIDSIEHRLGAIEVRLAGIPEKVTEVERRIVGVEKEIQLVILQNNGVPGRVGSAEKTITEVRDDINRAKTALRILYLGAVALGADRIFSLFSR